VAAREPAVRRRASIAARRGGAAPAGCRPGRAVAPPGRRRGAGARGRPRGGGLPPWRPGGRGARPRRARGGARPPPRPRAGAALPALFAARVFPLSLAALATTCRGGSASVTVPEATAATIAVERRAVLPPAVIHWQALQNTGVAGPRTSLVRAGRQTRHASQE